MVKIEDATTRDAAENLLFVFHVRTTGAELLVIVEKPRTSTPDLSNVPNTCDPGSNTSKFPECLLGDFVSDHNYLLWKQILFPRF